MGTPAEDFALLLEAANPEEVEMARGLLASAGIPCLVHGPDFDVAELGTAAHAVIRHQNVYVPNSAFEQASTILAEAWGTEPED